MPTCQPPAHGVYTQLTNRTHGRVGHVFQGRFKAILIDEKFINKMSLLAAQISTGSGTSVSGSRRDIPNIQSRPKPMALEALERQHPNNRNAAIQAAFATGGYTMAQLAQHFQLHYTSVSRIVKVM